MRSARTFQFIAGIGAVMFVVGAPRGDLDPHPTVIISTLSLAWIGLAMIGVAVLQGGRRRNRFAGAALLIGGFGIVPIFPANLAMVTLFIGAAVGFGVLSTDRSYDRRARYLLASSAAGSLVLAGLFIAGDVLWRADPLGIAALVLIVGTGALAAADGLMSDGRKAGVGPATTQWSG